jgi:hypothetical protein
MMIALLAASSGRDLTEFNIFLTAGSFLFASRRLDGGQIIRVGYATSGGVLSILSHANYSLRVGFPNDGDGQLQWADAPSGIDGFYSLGQSPTAVVEITATRDTELFLSSCYVGGACARIVAGHSQSVRFSDSGTCFLSTDLMSSLTVSGGADNTTVVIGTVGGDRLYSGGLATRLSVRPFGFVSVTGGDARGLELEFAGGDIKYQFGTVTTGTAAGVVGKGVFREYVPIEVGQATPDAGKVWGPLAIIFTVVTVTMLVAFFICSLVCFLGMISKMRRAEDDSSLPHPLYDRPVEGESDTLSSETSESKQAPTKQGQEPEPISPYDTV